MGTTHGFLVPYESSKRHFGRFGRICRVHRFLDRFSRVGTRTAPVWASVGQAVGLSEVRQRLDAQQHDGDERHRSFG